MNNNDENSKQINLHWLFLLVLTWFAITQFTPLLNKIFDFYSINPWILPYIRMALMLLVTWA